jgi:hypothetical protein
VDTVVCFEDTAGACRKTLAVARDIPARSFAGGMVSFASPGYFRARSGDTTVHALALNNSFDYLRGRGGFALGARVGANAATDFGRERHTFFSLPLSLLGYWGYPAFDLYAGGGYTPYASVKTRRDDTASRRTRQGFQLLVGARVVLRSARNFRISAGLEGQQQFLNDASWTSVTGNLGLHL